MRSYALAGDMLTPEDAGTRHECPATCGIRIRCNYRRSEPYSGGRIGS